MDGSPHRLYVDASWSVLATWGTDELTCTNPDDFTTCHPSPEHFDYGPGISLGYALMSASGLTFSVGGGVGRSVHSYHAMTRPMLQVGIGWTWRQRRS